MSTTILLPDSLAYPLPASLFYCESWWRCYTSPGRRYTWRQPFDALIATAYGLSIIPRGIYDLLDVVLNPEPAWGHRRVPSWYGIACRIGRAEISLPLQGRTLLLRPFSLLVRVPERDPPEVPPYILLGNQFFEEYGAVVQIDFSGTGQAVIP